MSNYDAFYSNMLKDIEKRKQECAARRKKRKLAAVCVLLLFELLFIEMMTIASWLK